jgi:hypothetical protein
MGLEHFVTPAGCITPSWRGKDNWKRGKSGLNQTSEVKGKTTDGARQ